MNLTAKTIGWLNKNRHRSYPMKRDGWRERVSPESGLDCVLLDALVVNCDAAGDEVLRMVSISVSQERTKIDMEYGGRLFSVSLSGDGAYGDGSMELVHVLVPGARARSASASFVTSSHAYILEHAGEGAWDIGSDLLESRTVNVSDGFGVDGIAVNGSRGVEGHGTRVVASGDVVLEDGYRTSPVIHNGGVLVRVGNKYGLDPCRFDYGDAEDAEHTGRLLFFCGQNGVNSGDVAISGGRGIAVGPASGYVMKSGALQGRVVPCIEIVAGRELMDIYRPTAQS